MTTKTIKITKTKNGKTEIIEIPEFVFEMLVKKRLEQMGVMICKCEACGKEVIFLNTTKGKIQISTLGLVSHFADCTDPERFRKNAS